MGLTADEVLTELAYQLHHSTNGLVVMGLVVHSEDRLHGTRVEDELRRGSLTRFEKGRPDERWSSLVRREQRGIDVVVSGSLLDRK